MKRLTLDQQFTYLVAVSYGPDSMALLSMLLEQGFNVHVAHVNYHRRADSNLEQTGLEQYCLSHDIPCYVLDVSQPLPAGNFQAQARDLRYRFFQAIMKENQLDVLLTGHHQDDHLETAMFHEQRQSWVPYAGMQRETTLLGMKVIRPLLAMSKTALLTYCDNHQIPYALDASNAQTTYTRNRLRQTIATWTLEQRTEELARIDKKNHHQSQMIQTLQLRYPTFLPLNSFQTDDQTIFWMLYGYFQRHGVSFPITRSLIQQLKKIAQSSKPNWSKSIDQGLFIKHYDRFEWIVLPDLKPYQFQYHGKTMRSAWVEIHPDAPDFPHWLIKGTRIRNALPTDRWLHQDQHLKLNRLFGDWKMPMYLRKYWPVFVNAKGKIIYTPRYQREPIVKPLKWLTIYTNRK
jgi:tRNA(Ile)-lysidine synthase